MTGKLDTIATDTLATLREAITSINNQADVNADVTANRVGNYASQAGGTPDVIDFNIPGVGVQKISATSAEPTIIQPLTINGYSQTSASANTLNQADNAIILIQLDGTLAGSNVDGLTLGAGSGGSTIEGLDLTNFSGNGIVVDSNGNSVLGNFIGVDPTGTTRMPNGTFPNAGAGILIQNASNNQIGSANPADRNITSGNALDGVQVKGTLTGPATNNTIQGNFVGVAADGKSSVGNRTEPAPAPGTAEGNNLFGIEVNGANNTLIGGPAAGAGNVVGFNYDGIEVDDGGQNNIIQGNFVGVGADGTTLAANVAHGIALRSTKGFTAPFGPAQLFEPGTSNNLIGGTAAGDGNVVANNGSAGIAVFGNPLSASGQPNIGNAIEGNTVFLNGRSNPSVLLGIDLTNRFPYPQDDGVTPNDSQGHNAPNDPNNFQNFPVLTSAVSGGGQTTITGTLTATPGLVYRIEFFASDSDPLGGAPEGQQFLGFVNVTTNASGTASFSTTLNVAVANGRIVTATATDPVGNTSEFSAGLPVPTTAPVPPSSPPPSPSSSPSPSPTPSPSSPPPFVSVAFGPFGEVLEVVGSNDVLIQFDATGAHVVASGVRSASVAFGPAGEELLVTFQDGRLGLFDATGAHGLGSGVLDASIANGPGGLVIEVVSLNGTLTQFDANGAHAVAGGVQSASVAFDATGAEVLDVVFPSGILEQFNSAGAVVVTGGVLAAGVAFDATGAEVLDIIFQDGTLDQLDATGFHTFGKVL